MATGNAESLPSPERLELPAIQHLRISHSPSTTSTSTSGGVEFDILCERFTPNYSFNIKDIEDAKNKKEVTDNIYKKISDVLEALEIGASKRIGKFYIGKTYIHKYKRGSFVPTNPGTFTKKGIKDRWDNHKKQDYGKDGMVVVAIVTSKVAKNLGYSNTQDCALDIEKELQRRFRDDGRLANDITYHPGRRERGNAKGYPIYIAFSYLESRHRKA